MRPTGPRSAAIDSPPDPQLVARFGTDLAALFPAAGEGAQLGLAVSGGPDSMAMLLLAHAAFPGQIAAASVDHGLRAESASECSLVAGICESLGIPHVTLTVKLASGNLQGEARKARYAALANWAAEQGLHAVLTAHHADDQAETVVMRLNRGSGIDGLAGVRARATMLGTNAALLRPLLEWRKMELEALVAAAGIEPARDPSNTDERFDRTRIRTALDNADWFNVSGAATSAANLADAAEALAWLVEIEQREKVLMDDRSAAYQSDAPFAVQLQVVARMVAQLADTPRQGALARLMRAIGKGDQVNIAGALIKRTADGWNVASEPARRA